MDVSAASAGCPAAPTRITDPYQDPDMVMAGFANNYPDLYFRCSALLSLGMGANNRAVRILKRAARAGDKPPQVLMAEILFSDRHPQRLAAGEISVGPQMPVMPSR